MPTAKTSVSEKDRVALERLARLLAEQALSLRGEERAWVREALNEDVFRKAVKRARTGASFDKAFEPGSRTRQVVLDAATKGGLHILARHRPGTGERGVSLGKIDVRTLRRLHKEIGPIETAWVLFACPEVQPPSVVKAATAAALAALCPPEQHAHEGAIPGSQPSTPSVPDTAPAASAPELSEHARRLERLEQQVRNVLDKLKADTQKERDHGLRRLPSFASLLKRVEDHASRIKALEQTLESKLKKHTDTEVKSVRSETKAALKTLERELKSVSSAAKRADEAALSLAKALERHGRELQEVCERLGALESSECTPEASSGALVDELDQRLVAVEQVIDDLRSLFAPAEALVVTEPLPDTTEAPEEQEPSTVAAPAVQLIPAAAPDAEVAFERVRAARALREAARSVVQAIGAPDHLIVDGHNVVVEPLKSGRFSDERQARFWLITQMVALADTLDLNDVRIMFDTSQDTQVPESFSPRVRIQYCGPDTGKADGRIVRAIEELSPDDTTVVCTSDHEHVWSDVQALAEQDLRVTCVDRFALFDLLEAIERYLAAHEDLPAETRIELAREELDAELTGQATVAERPERTRAVAAPRAATTPSSVIPQEHLDAWLEALRRHDHSAAEQELAYAERAGARHPYLTLAQSVGYLARGNADAALETLSRFDVDPYAGPNMRVQVGLIRLLAHNEGLGRLIEASDIEQVLEKEHVATFDVRRGSLGIYLQALRSASETLEHNVGLILRMLGGTQPATAGVGPGAEAPVTRKTDPELLRRAGVALAEGQVDEAARLYDLIEAQGVARRHAYINRAMVELARGHVGEAREAIRRYGELAETPMMRLQAVVLEEIARALDGDIPDATRVALARERVDGFQPHLSPVWYLARCLRQGQADPEVEGVLAAAGF